MSIVFQVLGYCWVLQHDLQYHCTQSSIRKLEHLLWWARGFEGACECPYGMHTYIYTLNNMHIHWTSDLFQLAFTFFKGVFWPCYQGLLIDWQPTLLHTSVINGQYNERIEEDWFSYPLWFHVLNVGKFPWRCWPVKIHTFWKTGEWFWCLRLISRPRGGGSYF